MWQCWNFKPNSRPCFESLTKQLSTLLELEVPQGYIKLKCASDETFDVENDQASCPQSGANNAKLPQEDTVIFNESSL